MVVPLVPLIVLLVGVERVQLRRASGGGGGKAADVAVVPLLLDGCCTRLGAATASADAAQGRVRRGRILGIVICQATGRGGGGVGSGGWGVGKAAARAGVGQWVHPVRQAGRQAQASSTGRVPRCALSPAC